MQHLQHRPLGAVLAVAGLAALVVVLVATPDATGFVLAAWVLVLAGVAAVALGIALGFRHQAHVDDGQPARRHYLTADWVGGAQQFTVGDRAEPPPPEPAPAPVDEPVDEPETPPALQPQPPSEPELEPTGVRWTRYPRVAAALMVANAVRELVKPGRAAR
ncbi:MAG TPA: hypothetical protein VG076_09620 [Acidimicrobiales bacterium]|jgi:hypothetical protein|nr:hypothetical protein [Acidimicrobiales bacterium]